MNASAARRVAGIEEGIATLRTSLAVLRSVAEGRPIALAELAVTDPPPNLAEGLDGGAGALLDVGS